MSAPIFWTATVLLCVIPISARSIDISACRQTVPEGETGVLQADLVCGDVPGSSYAVFVGRGATFQLNGHSITAAPGDPAHLGVACQESCTVVGPGDVSGFGACVTAAPRLQVSDIDVHDCERGVVAPRMEATNVTANDNSEWGFGSDRLRGTNLTANGNVEYGFYGEQLDVDGLTAMGNDEEGLSIFKRARVSNATVNDNGTIGILSPRLIGRNVTAIGNGDFGISANRLKLRDSTITGNNGGGLGYDLVSDRRPRLLETVCGKSISPMPPFPTTWGVCALD